MATELDDVEAISKTLGGETDAYAELVRRYNRRLFYFLLAKMSDDSEAEDLVQKTFISAYHSLERYDPAQSSFIVWLRSIALNHCRDEWKHQERQARLKDRLLEARRAQLELDNLESTADMERIGALRECFDNLSDSDQQLLQQRFIEQQPLAVLAQSAGKDSEALRLMLYRLRQRLAACVRKRLALKETPA